MVYISKWFRVGQRRILNHVVEAATVVTGFERPVLCDLVIHAEYRFVLPIGLLRPLPPVPTDGS